MAAQPTYLGQQNSSKLQNRRNMKVHHRINDPNAQKVSNAHVVYGPVEKVKLDIRLMHNLELFATARGRRNRHRIFQTTPISPRVPFSNNCITHRPMSLTGL
jgi:hypothetical protein